MSIRVAVLVVSDSRDERTDRSGAALQTRAAELGWTSVKLDIVKDEIREIAAWVERTADSGEADVILCTGGTGVAPRDVTPEAIRPLLDKEMPGLGELMRLEGLKFTNLAHLSRSFGGTRGRVCIAALPGSPKGAVQSLDAVAHLVPHILGLIRGESVHLRKPQTA